MLDVFIWMKITAVLFGVVYCIWVSVKLKLISKKSLYQIEPKKHWRKNILTFLVIISFSIVFMYFLHPEDMFIVVKKKPLMWLGILFFYAVFSVYPQELLYRSYFFNRYDGIFKNEKYLILANVLAFPLAHLLFKNEMVLFVTFVGGIIFALTYRRSKSVLYTSIEHALYGNWLFTVGMGEMLAFPMPN